MAADALVVEPQLGSAVGNQLSAASAALAVAPLVDAEPEAPDRMSLAAVRRAGRPWSAVATIASRLREAQQDLERFATRLIEPDDRLRWRLFHLAVLGEVLLALVHQGFRIVSLSPLSASAVGANYRAVHESREPLDVWFEAAGIWRASSVRSPYVDATAALGDGGGRPLGPDLLLISRRRALVFECKYSAQRTYVASGYEQVLAYTAELTGSVVDTASAAVVGPDSVVDRSSAGDTGVGRVHVLPASAVDALVAGWIR